MTNIHTTELESYYIRVLFLSVSNLYCQLLVNRDFKQVGLLPVDVMDSEEDQQIVEYLLSIENKNKFPLQDNIRLILSRSGRKKKMRIIHK